jgi:hypothetical protein
MNHVDARGVARVALNSTCRRQAAMVLFGLSDRQCRDVFSNLPNHGGCQERAAALRWGVVFDRALTQGGAARLLASLQGTLGLMPDAAVVRDLRAEVPGGSAAAAGERSRRVRAVLADLVAGNPVPDVLIQPPLTLAWGDRDWGRIVPDALVLDRARLAYVPVEAKGLVAVDGVVPAADRGRMRLQAAVQVHALRAEFARLGQVELVMPCAFLVVATPFGFRPAAAVMESLEAEVEAVGSALQALEDVRAALATQPRGHDPAQFLPRTPPTFREACLSRCCLADACRAEVAGVRGVVGDRAADLVGPSLDLGRARDLLGGAPTVGADEEHVLVLLRDAATVFGWSG